MHASILKRHSEVLSDQDRTVLLATFLHPYFCKKLLKYQVVAGMETDILTEDSIALVGDFESGIIHAMGEDLPPSFREIKRDPRGKPLGSLIEHQVMTYITAVKEGQFGPLSADMDVLKLTVESPIYSLMPAIKVQAQSYLAGTPSSSLTEGSFSLMGWIHSPVRSRLSTGMMASLALLTADARNEAPETRKTEPYSQVAVALLCLKTVPRFKAIAQVKSEAAAKAASAAQASSSSSSSSSAAATTVPAAGKAAVSAVEEVDDGDVQAALLEALGEASRSALVDSDGNFLLEEADAVIDKVEASVETAESVAATKLSALLGSRAAKGPGAAGSSSASASSASSAAAPSMPASATKAGVAAVRNSVAAASAAARDLDSLDLGPKPGGHSSGSESDGGKPSKRGRPTGSKNKASAVKAAEKEADKASKKAAKKAQKAAKKGKA